VTDRQRDLLRVVAQMPASSGEFTVQEIVAASQDMLDKPFASSRVSAILASLIEAGLVYKNRHGRYRFAVPMFSQFILRHLNDAADGALW
jgi:DNA-binding IclR family transcriptional regulator